MVIVLKALYIPALMLLAFAVGWASWHLLEKRILKFKERFSYT